MISALFLKMLNIFSFCYTIVTPLLLLTLLVKVFVGRFRLTLRHFIYVFFWFILIFIKEFRKEENEILY